MLVLRFQSRVACLLLLAWLGVLLAVSAVTAAQAIDMAQPVAVTAAATNPHWSKEGCVKCHAKAVGPIAATDVTPLCMSCHDGVHAGDEAHPIGRTMSERLADPGWPTVNRTVQCLTCHDVKQQCDAAAERPEANAAFLRQVNGGTTPFCQSCHREEQTPKFNPHRMLEDDLHTPIEARCQVCHDKQLDTKGGVRTGDASLRADQVTLCRSCHPRHRDISPVGHVLAKIEPGMLTYMRAREITGLLNTPGQDLLTQLAAQGAQPTLMVPDGQGRVVCSTCHNPHERGTFAPGTVLDDRSLRLMKGRLVTPVRGELFCRHCHNL